MRKWLLVLVLGVGACSRKVVLQTSPAAVVEVSIKVTNNAAQAVSVYVQAGGAVIFLKQVAAKSSESLAVPGVSAGTTVRLRATLADGSRSYTREGVVLNGVFEWQVP